MSVTPSLLPISPTLTVHIGPTAYKRFLAAQAQFTGLNAMLAMAKLAVDIKRWKVLTPTNQVVTVEIDEIGRDKSNRDPAPSPAWHAHMQPPSPAGLKDWRSNQGKPAIERISDYCLVYSLLPSAPQHGLFVLDVVGEIPSGHRIWDADWAPARDRWEKYSTMHQAGNWLPLGTKTF